MCFEVSLLCCVATERSPPSYVYQPSLLVFETNIADFGLISALAWELLEVGAAVLGRFALAFGPGGMEMVSARGLSNSLTGKVNDTMELAASRLSHSSGLRCLTSETADNSIGLI